MYVSRFIVDSVYYPSYSLPILFITDPIYYRSYAGQDWIAGLDL